jgi:hypothetical protein
MPSRLAKFTQSEAKRLFKAAAMAGVNVRVEFRADGTIIATAGAAAPTADVDTDLDVWMKEHADTIERP